MIINNTFLNLLAIALSIILSLAISFLFFKRKQGFDMEGFLQTAVFLAFLLIPGSFIFISYKSHIIIDVYSDSTSNLFHHKRIFFGNVIIKESDFTIKTADYKNYKTIVINHSNSTLVIDRITYTKSNQSKNYYYTGETYIVPRSCEDFSGTIRYFLEYDKPPKSISVSFSNKVTTYWLHKYR